MTPDQQFKRWIKWAMACFILVFGYFLLADIKMPLTPQAMATRVVTKMAPQVSGKVVEVAVVNNQHVKQGDLLFVLDPAPFELAVEQARLALDQAEQQNRQLDATLNAAAADFSSLQTQTAQKQREAERIDTLYRRHMVSEQQKDDADSAARTARANLLASQARMEQARVNRGLTTCCCARRATASPRQSSTSPTARSMRARMASSPTCSSSPAAWPRRALPCWPWSRSRWT